MAMRALYTAATGMTAQAVGIDVIANNLANVSTTAFKRQRVNFEDLLYQIEKPAGKSGNDKFIPSGTQVGLGTRVASTNRVFTQGSLIVTDRPFDIAVEGKGFFKLTLPADIGGGEGYTRSGVFSLDADGNMVSPDGYAMNPPITIDQDVQEVAIGRDGTVSVRRSSAAALEEVGRIEMADFANPEGLIAHGQSIFLEGEASGAPISGNPGEGGFGELQQGSLESSNVEVVKELVSMIESQRAFEMNSQVIQTSNEALQVVANLIRF